MTNDNTVEPHVLVSLLPDALGVYSYLLRANCVSRNGSRSNSWLPGANGLKKQVGNGCKADQLGDGFNRGKTRRPYQTELNLSGLIKSSIGLGVEWTNWPDRELYTSMGSTAAICSWKKPLRYGQVLEFATMGGMNLGSMPSIPALVIREVRTFNALGQIPSNYFGTFMPWR